MNVDRNAAAIIFDRAGAIIVDADRNLGTVIGQRFVNRVVHDLKDAVVQSAFVGIANIHVGALAHALESLQLLDLGGVVNILVATLWLVVVANWGDEVFRLILFWHK